MVCAEHPHARTKLGASKRDHVLADMGSHHLTVLWGGIVQNPLNKIVSVLVTGNIDEWDPGSIGTALADAVEIAAQKISASYF